MSLPDAFCRQMKTYYAKEWPALKHALTQPAVRGARLQKYALEPDDCAVHQSTGNPVLPSETHQAQFNIRMPWLNAASRPAIPEGVRRRILKPVPWYEDAYYISEDSDLGKTVFHELGGIYLQEPSATAAVAALNPEPHERILDLCAAPGSKSTAIGRRLRGQALLYANDVHPQRVTVLAQNLERAGIPACITNNQPETLASVWPHAFDAVLVDAPCSGEGMFRKDPTAIEQWSPQTVNLCVSRQRDILTQAVRLVKPGGRIVYSTCTLNPFENEQVAAWASTHLPLQLEPLPDWPHWEAGRPELAEDFQDLQFTRRLWPHSGMGEGHFVARFRVLENTRDIRQANESLRHGTRSSRTKPAKIDWRPWLQEIVRTDAGDWPEPVTRGDGLFLAVNRDLTTENLTVLRDGVCLARQVHKRLVPHHQAVMAIHPDAWQQHRVLDEEEVGAYLAGQTLSTSKDRGYVALSYGGLPVGWGKSIPGRLNNLYPKGLRRSHLIIP